MKGQVKWKIQDKEAGIGAKKTRITRLRLKNRTDNYDTKRRQQFPSEGTGSHLKLVHQSFVTCGEAGGKKLEYSNISQHVSTILYPG